MRRGADFTLTTRNGTKVTRGRVVAYVHLSSSPGVLVGLIVGKSVGNAVARHRVSRRLRASMAKTVSTLPPGTRVVLRALPGALEDPELARDGVEAVIRASSRAASRRGV